MQGVSDGYLNDFDLTVTFTTDKEPNSDIGLLDLILNTVKETGNNKVLIYHSRSVTPTENSTDVVNFVNNCKDIIENKWKELECGGKIHIEGIIGGTNNISDTLNEFDNCDYPFLLSSCQTIE